VLAFAEAGQAVPTLRAGGGQALVIAAGSGKRTDRREWNAFDKLLHLAAFQHLALQEGLRDPHQRFGYPVISPLQLQPISILSGDKTFLISFYDQVVPAAVFSSSGRTGFGTSRLPALTNKLGTEAAFLDSRPRAFPLIARNLERTGLHAISASDALVLVIEHRALLKLGKGSYRTNGNTRKAFNTLSEWFNDFNLIS
jgi:hypothetical protein